MADLLFTKLVIDNQNFVIPDAGASQKGLMSSSDYTKLSQIALGAQVNVIEKIKFGDNDLSVDDNKRVDLSNVVQAALTAGTGISITNNTISCTLDNTPWVIKTALPEGNAAPEQDANKIWMVPATSTGTDNVYIEWIWTGSVWEKVGEYKADVDLSNYVTKDTGKGLSSNDFTNTLKEKLEGISEGANKVTYSHDAATQTLTLSGITATPVQAEA